MTDLYRVVIRKRSGDLIAEKLVEAESSSAAVKAVREENLPQAKYAVGFSNKLNRDAPTHIGNDIWVLVGGEVLTNVHPADSCLGGTCVIHNPSDHHMRSWRMHWRDDRGIMERLCPDRGIGHPDPDDYRINYLGTDEGVHGCDGCCWTGPVEVPKDERLELRVLIGVPGCGKSTLARRWLEEGVIDAVVSSDSVRWQLTGDAENFTEEPKVWAHVRRQVEDHLARGRSVVLDATNLIPEFRKAWLEIGEATNVPVTAYRCALPWGSVWLRNRKRNRVVPDDIMRRMWENWDSFCTEKTLAAEGFSVITEEIL